MLLDNICELNEPVEEFTGPTSAAGPVAGIVTHSELPAGEVHVWLADLNQFGPDGLLPLLSPDELTRADSFYFTEDRNHFIVARGLLRKLLASYLSADAGRLSFTYAEKGKPSLVDGPDAWLKFNLAHSRDLALFAFSRDREIGVDLEFIRNDVAEEELAERFFSESEAQTLKALPHDRRRQGFFNCWTRKEAYIKARGAGLSMSLAEFAVSLAPGDEAALLHNRVEPDELNRWAMKVVDVPAGYAGALVAAGQAWQLKQFELEEK